MSVQLAFTAIMLAVGLFVVLIRKKIDLFTIFFSCAFIYFFPAFLGDLNHPGVQGSVLISNSTYSVLIKVVLVMFYFLVVNDFCLRGGKSIVESRFASASVGKFETVWFCFFYILVLTIFFATADIYTLVSSGKDKVSSSSGPVYGIAIWFSISACIVGYLNRNFLIFMIGVSFVIFSLYVGSRAYFVTFILSMALLHFGYRELKCSRKIKVIFIGVLAFLFVLFYKYFYLFLKVGDYNSLFEALVSSETYLVALSLSEPNLVIMHINNIIQNDINVPAYYVWDRVLRFFPFFSDFVGSSSNIEFQSFSDVLNDRFYRFDYGVGSSFWAELIYLFGFSGVLVGIFLYSFLIFCFSMFLLRLRGIALPIFLPLFIYLTFYVHRIEIYLMAAVFKSTLVLVFIWFVMYLVKNSVDKNVRPSDC